MNDTNLNDVLASIGINDITTMEIEPLQEPEPLSLEDVDSILVSAGFPEILDADSEEITDESITALPEPSQNMNEDGLIQLSESINEIVPDSITFVTEELVSTSDSDDSSTEESQNENTLPLNSPTLLLDASTSRFSGTTWYEAMKHLNIIVAGIGGIGSNAVYQIARMTPAAIYMYDGDIVDVANMSGQLYSREDIGVAKVDALYNMISRYTNTPAVISLNENFTSTTEAGDIMICGFDNMHARKVFFNAWKQHVLSTPEAERNQCLYLDGRLSIDNLQVFCITGDNTWAMEEYSDNYLFLDSEADATICSMKQTTYLACMIGSFITNLLVNFVANQTNPIISYDLPFFTEYDAQNMIFKTKK